MLKNTFSMISIPFFILLCVEFSIQTRENDRWGTGVSRQYRGCPLPKNHDGTADLRLLDAIAKNASQNDNARDMSAKKQPLMETDQETMASTNRAPLGKRPMQREAAESRDGPVPKKCSKERAPRFSCDTCGNSYARMYYLKLHQKLHSKGIDSYKCSQCNKTYGMKNSLKQHLNRQHTGDIERKKCEFCNVDFKEQQSLNTHIRMVHGNGMADKYPCPHCNSKYKYKKDLQRHMVTKHNVTRNWRYGQRKVDNVSI